jgi:hypothetical protein
LDIPDELADAQYERKPQPAMQWVAAPGCADVPAFWRRKLEGHVDWSKAPDDWKTNLDGNSNTPALLAPKPETGRLDAPMDLAHLDSLESVFFADDFVCYAIRIAQRFKLV